MYNLPLRASQKNMQDAVALYRAEKERCLHENTTARVRTQEKYRSLYKPQNDGFMTGFQQKLDRNETGSFTLTVRKRPRTHWFSLKTRDITWVVRDRDANSISYETMPLDVSNDINTVVLKNHRAKNKKTPKTYTWRRIGNAWCSTSC